jgi:hypothetical protein
MLLATIDRRADATVQLAGAQASLEQLISQNPDDIRFQAALADCYEQLSRLHRADGQPDAAQKEASKALEIRGRLANDGGGAAAQIDLITALPHDAATFGAIPQLVQRVLDDWPRDPAAMYEAACRLTIKAPVLTRSPHNGAQSQ